MKYVDRVIQPGEAVQYASTIHWIVYLPSILLFALGAVGLALLGKSGASMAKPLPLPLGLIVAGVGFLGGLVTFLPAWTKRRTTELAVTTRRVIYKRGFVSGPRLIVGAFLLL
jgi:hypothetical protein